MTPIENYLVIACAVVVLATVAAATITAGVQHHREPAVEPPTPTPGLWLPCHTTRCGHLTTPHHPSPTGPICTNCGATNGDQP